MKDMEATRWRAAKASAIAPPSPRTVLIVGATSAVAERMAALYAADGARLVLAARNAAALRAVAQNLRIRFGTLIEEVLLDAADSGSMEAAAARLGSGLTPDVVIFAVGANASAEAPQDAHEIARVTAVNYSVIPSLIAALLPGLRIRERAAIAIISSVAGDRGRKSNFVYGAAKAAANAYAQGLRGLLHPRVTVTTVKLGYVDSRMSYGLSRPSLTVSPEYAARAIRDAIDRRRDVVYVPGVWRWVMLVIRLIPERAFKRLNL